MQHLPQRWRLVSALTVISLLFLGLWRFQAISNTAPGLQMPPDEPQTWPPSIDDAPRLNGYYAYARFDSDAGPFLNRDLPVIYLDKAKRQTACFSGRIDGHLRHIIVATEFGRVITHDPETDVGWAVSGCSDALISGSHIPTTHEYWQTRLTLLPDVPANAQERQAVTQHIKALRPWWWPWSARH